MPSQLPPTRSSSQKKAIDLLRRSPHPGVVTSSASAMIDNQPWIHWRTAYALEKAGVVNVEPYGEADAEIYLREKVY